MLDRAVAAAAARVPVIAGIAQTAVASARREIASAAEAGTDAVLLAPPFSYPVDQPTVKRFDRSVAFDAGIPVPAITVFSSDLITEIPHPGSGPTAIS
jgi:dihydrodipicolinate synthase/N-acetylneuraminate lyase